MGPKDYCRKCGGTMKIIQGLNPVMACPKCKDTFGWDPDAWKAEQKRKEKADAQRKSAEA